MSSNQEGTELPALSQLFKTVPSGQEGTVWPEMSNEKSVEWLGGWRAVSKELSSGKPPCDWKGAELPAWHAVAKRVANDREETKWLTRY